MNDSQGVWVLKATGRLRQLQKQGQELFYPRAPWVSIPTRLSLSASEYFCKYWIMLPPGAQGFTMEKVIIP